MKNVLIVLLIVVLAGCGNQQNQSGNQQKQSKTYVERAEEVKTPQEANELIEEMSNKLEEGNLKLEKAIAWANFTTVTMTYLNSKQMANWWMKKPPSSPTTSMIQEAGRWEILANDAVERYKNVSPVAAEIAERFTDIYVGFAIGIGVMSNMEGPGDINQIGVVFVSEAEKPNHPSSVYYNERWNAVGIAAIDWSPAVFDALVLHELGHALYALQGKASSKARTGSDAWIGEELIMHKLEMDVLNESSDGAYIDALDAILESRPPKTIADIYGKMEGGELEALDQSLGLGSMSSEEASIIAAQHVTSLAFRYCEEMSESERERLMTSFYRSVTRM